VANGERDQQGGFVRLHMTDVASPPQYEVNLYIGFDPRQHDYVVETDGRSALEIQTPQGSPLDSRHTCGGRVFDVATERVEITDA